MPTDLLKKISLHQPDPRIFLGNVVSSSDWIGDTQIFVKLGEKGNSKLFHTLSRKTPKQKDRTITEEDIESHLKSRSKCDIVVEPSKITSKSVTVGETYKMMDTIEMIPISKVKARLGYDVSGGSIEHEADKYLAAYVRLDLFRLAIEIVGHWDDMVLGFQSRNCESLMFRESGSVVGLIRLAWPLENVLPPAPGPLEPARPIPGIEPEYDRKTAPSYDDDEIMAMMTPEGVTKCSAFIKGEAGDVFFSGEVTAVRDGKRIFMTAWASQEGRGLERFAERGINWKDLKAAIHRKTGHQPKIRRLEVSSITGTQEAGIPIDALLLWMRTTGAYFRIWTNWDVDHLLSEGKKDYYVVEERDAGTSETKPSRLVAYPLDGYLATIKRLTGKDLVIESVHNENWIISSNRIQLKDMTRKTLPKIETLLAAIRDPKRRVALGKPRSGLYSPGTFLEAARRASPGSIFKMDAFGGGKKIHGGHFELLADCRTIVHHPKGIKLGPRFSVIQLASEPESLSEFVIRRSEDLGGFTLDPPGSTWHSTAVVQVVPYGTTEKKTCAARLRSMTSRYDTRRSDAGMMVTDRLTGSSLGPFEDENKAHEVWSRLNKIDQLANEIEADFGG